MAELSALTAQHPHKVSLRAREVRVFFEVEVTANGATADQLDFIQAIDADRWLSWEKGLAVPPVALACWGLDCTAFGWSFPRSIAGDHLGADEERRPSHHPLTRRAPEAMASTTRG